MGGARLAGPAEEDLRAVEEHIIGGDPQGEPFCKSQFPHESVNLSFIITNIKNKLTDLCGK